MNDTEITKALIDNVPCGVCAGVGYGEDDTGSVRCEACLGRGVDHAATQTNLLRALLTLVRRWGR